MLAELAIIGHRGVANRCFLLRRHLLYTFSDGHILMSFCKSCRDWCIYQMTSVLAGRDRTGALRTNMRLMVSVYGRYSWYPWLQLLVL